jgi:hypothetical protein
MESLIQQMQAAQELPQQQQQQQQLALRAAQDSMGMPASANEP